MTRFALALAGLVLVGCASTPRNPLPPDYAGPSAWIADSGSYESDGKAQIFVLMELDGVAVDNAISATRRASQGQGFSLSAQYIDRRVPVRELVLRLRGTHITAAPIHEIASRASGNFHSVEGTVPFKPVDGKNYVVRGTLRPDGSEVWIEDADSKERVSEVVKSNR